MVIYTNSTRLSRAACNSSTRPVHVAEPVGRFFLDTCTRQIERQLEKLSNPGFGGTARVEATEYFADLLTVYEERSGQPCAPDWTA
jgi:hypothetical protein